MSNSEYFILGFIVACALLVLFCWLAFVFASEDKFYTVEYFKFNAPTKGKYIARERVKNLKFKKNYVKFISTDNICERVNYVYFISSMKEER